MIEPMLGRTYDSQVCSVAGSLELVGERWTLLIVRDAFMGARRFEDFQRRTGMARNVLTARLGRLVEEGIFERVQYQEHPARHDYRLTEKGIDLWPVIVSLLQWGDHYVYPGRAPVLLVHKNCGGAVDDHRICETCGAKLGPRDVQARQGIGGGMVAPAPA
ncbi:MAG TPA: helix-turn-helix domain-containing protein [Candidatus Dormibacteraeota bacterium]|jgi:DNA-binding HxlR family transcriptional regulator|nr:helix-turn-helix domain-containing protein [Candidatus Dormibacteraeota bacterium]